MEPRPPAVITPFTVTGRVTVHTRGFGFLSVARDDGTTLSAFITPPELNAFLADDVVRATVSPSGEGRFTASALALLERPRDQLFGELVSHRGQPHLRVDREVANTDWPLDANGLELTAGDAVVARTGQGVAVAVRKLAPGADRALERVIARHGIRSEFPADALAEARAATQKPHALGARRDLRDVPTVTVDAPSTRDIDDAISLLPAGPDGALRLLVSIADPSEFIPDGGPLDRAARERATSTYLAGRVLPMLPDELSSDWLSLHPGQDRCCLTVELRIDPEGRVTAADVYESLIRSWARLNYTEMAAFLDTGAVTPAMEPLRDALPWFRTASARLEVARRRRGGVELAREEGRVTLDPRTGAASGVTAEPATSAHKLIERFMVAANEAIARWLADRGVPAPFRVHPSPDPLAVEDLAAFAHNFGYDAGFGRALSPLALAAFDAQITGAASEPAIRQVLLRALGPALYTARAEAHFGLAAPLYLHFTSPLRRYADLTVHRTIKQYLRGRRDFAADEPGVEALAQHINIRARASARAETDRYRMLTAQWMAGNVGREYAAHVTRVRPFGLVAQLDTTLVDGTIPLNALPGGPYAPDARETALVGPVRSFVIGAALTVRIAGADPALGRIELALVEP